MHNAKQLRLFIALWPDEATRDALAHIQVSLQGRKTLRGNFHLTLAFLGQQPSHILPLLEEILTRVQQAPLSLMLNRIGYFSRQRVTWAGADKPPISLIGMQKGLMQDLTSNGIDINAAEKFQPHVTLARDAPTPEIAVFAPIVWCADRIALLESVTHTDGAAYRLITSHRLTNIV